MSPTPSLRAQARPSSPLPLLLTALLALATGLTASARAATLDVPSQYKTIAAALAAAQSGDTIIVADGAYDESGLNTNGLAVTLESANGPANCTIDGGQNGSVFTIDSGETASTVIQGFTIENGDGTPDSSGNLYGGGMYIANSSPTVADCVFTQDSVYGDYDGNPSGNGGGGAIYLSGSAATITGCTFSGDGASGGTYDDDDAGLGQPGGDGDGGAVYVTGGSPAITDCTFSGDSASGGEGDNSNNVGGSGGSGGSGGNGNGGALYLSGSAAVVTGCTFSANQSVGGPGNGGGDDQGYGGGAGGNGGGGSGGGAFIASGSPSLTGCTFVDDSAYGGGGGEGGYSYYSGYGGDGGVSGNGGGGGAYIASGDAVLSGCAFRYDGATGGDAAPGDDSDSDWYPGYAGDGTGGGACVASGSPTLSACVFYENGSAGGAGGAGSGLDDATDSGDGGPGTDGGDGYGGGASLGGGSPSVVNCVFIHNGGNGGVGGPGGDGGDDDAGDADNGGDGGDGGIGYGGGLSLSATQAAVTDCTFTLNNTTAGAGGPGGDGGNGGDNGAAGAAGSGDGGGIAQLSDSPLALTGAILWGDTAGSAGPDFYTDNTSAITVSHSDVEGDTYDAGKNGNLNTDPEFTYLPGDLRLQPGSPCLGAGIAIAGITTDADGVARPDPPSIGAYEAGRAGQGINFTVTLGDDFSGPVASFTDSAPASAFTATFSWGDGSAESKGIVQGAAPGHTVNGSHTYLKAGAYKVTVTVSGGAFPDIYGATATVIAPPAAPTLKADSAYGTIGLAWSVPPGPISSYRVYRGVKPGGEGAAPIAQGLSAPAYTDKSAVAGTIYYYKVRAVNAAGVGALSNEAACTPTLPTSPALAAATPRGPVVLTWTVPTVGHPTSYLVLRGTAPGAETPLVQGLKAATYTDAGARVNTLYYYKVLAVNTVGAGRESNEVAARPYGPPSAPRLSAATPKGVVTLAWTAPASKVTSYRVLRGTKPGGESSAPLASGLTATTYADKSAAAGTTYYYKVQALNLAGNGALSNEASARR